MRETVYVIDNTKLKNEVSKNNLEIKKLRLDNLKMRQNNGENLSEEILKLELEIEDDIKKTKRK